MSSSQIATVGGGGNSIRDLSKKSDNPPVEAEVRVDVRDGDEWVRIPITYCDLQINKDGPADITRNAKVKFPVEWDGRDITQFVNGFNEPTSVEPQFVGSVDEYQSQSYDECRVWFWDHELEAYQIAHYGFIGTIGPTSNTGELQFIVHDPADLLRRIPVSKSFGEPTIQQIVEFVLRGEDNQGRPVGLEQRSVFDNIRSYISGVQPVREAKESVEQNPVDEAIEEAVDGEFTIEGELPVVGALQLDVTDLVEDVYEAFSDDVLTEVLLTGQKRFMRNRDNLADLMEWFASEVGGKWHFEPTPSGPLLFIDNQGGFTEFDREGSLSRRFFVDDELAGASQSWDISEFEDRTEFDSVDVINNNALYDIKPINTLRLFGEGMPRVMRERDASDIAPSTGIFTNEFPAVKVTYPPLVRRAGGHEYAPPIVESDKVEIRQAEKEAVKQFREHLSESTEGSIEIRGEPHILPFDYIRTIPTCNDTYQNANATPITLEVNSVHHVRAAGKPYTTELGVSLVFDETKLEIESNYQET